MASLREQAGRVESRRGARWVETRVGGYVRAEHIKQMVAQYEEHGAGATWLLDASETLGYEASAVREAVDAFGRLAREKGLERMIVLITSPAVRMGASVVSMSLRAIGARVSIEIVSSTSALVSAGA